MKKNQIFLWVLLACVGWLGLLVGCKKDYNGPTVAQGRVLEYGTDLPVKGATIFFSYQSISGSHNNVDLGTAETDSLGYYKKTITDDADMLDFGMVVYKDGYDTKNNIGGLPRIINNINVVIEPFGWLRVFIKNIKHEIPLLRVSSELGPKLLDYDGLDLDTVFITKGVANKNTQLSFLKYVGSNTYWDYIKKESIYVIGRDTTNYYFTY
jgi:hypothetical protein